MFEFTRVTYGSVSRARNIEVPSGYDLVVVIQRSNPPTRAHERNVLTAACVGARVASVKGSAYHPRRAKDPLSDEEVEFTWSEIVKDNAEVREKLRFARVRDYYDNGKWGRNVEKEVYAILAADGIPRSEARVAILGHSKDETSFYLTMFPEWDQLEMPNYRGLNATDVRKLFYDADNLEGHWPMISTMVPAATLGMLKSLARLPAYERLVAEYRYINKILGDEQKFRELKNNPDWELNTNCADAVIECSDHVLMGYRTGVYGYGHLAFPGGVKGKETFLDACLRELSEETTFSFTKAYLVQNFLRDSHVFDHPGRSQASTRVSMAFYFNLGNLPLQEIWGKDDMAKRQMVWVPKKEWKDYAPSMFEDHDCIGDYFMHIYD
jgi:bifunctional NMN adenylyltransferase/nudix hydrolase